MQQIVMPCPNSNFCFWSGWRKLDGGGAEGGLGGVWEREEGDQLARRQCCSRNHRKLQLRSNRNRGKLNQTGQGYNCTIKNAPAYQLVLWMLNTSVVGNKALHSSYMNVQFELPPDDSCSISVQSKELNGSWLNLNEFVLLNRWSWYYTSDWFRPNQC